MQEAQLREAIGKSLPKIVTGVMQGIYPQAFQPEEVTPREYRLDSPIIGSQLAYTDNWQVLAYLVMEPGDMMNLGLKTFPKLARGDAPKMVISANGEILNSASAKLGFIISKVDPGREVTVTTPIVINCAGENGFPIPVADSLFLRLRHQDISFLFLASIQKI